MSKSAIAKKAFKWCICCEDKVEHRLIEIREDFMWQCSNCGDMKF